MDDSDDKRKHLDFIESTISRMSSNSFLTRGWTFTMVTALFTLYISKEDWRILLIIAIAVLLFWLTDAYYLSLEREYRKLFDRVRKNEVTNYQMEIAPTWRKMLDAMRSRVFLFSYLPIEIFTIGDIVCVHVRLIII